MDIKEVNLKKLIFPNRKCLIIGAPGSGKSVLIKDMFHNLRNYVGRARIMSGTEDFNHFYETEIGIPTRFIDGEYAPAILSKFKNGQKRIINDYMKKHKIKKKDDFTLKDHKNCGSFIVIDDCSYLKMNDKDFKDLIKNGRHYEAVVLITLQYCLDFGPETRNAIDVVVIFSDTNPENRKKIYKSFVGRSCGNFDTFNLLMDELVNNYTALFILRSKTSTAFEDNIFFYKATERKNIDFGSPQFKKYRS
jgi:nucleoside-triphosphatase THEP1